MAGSHSWGKFGYWIYIYTLSFESTTYFRYNWENQVLAICSLFMYLLPFSILGVIWHPLAIHHPFTPPLAPLGLQSRPDRGCGQRFDQVPPIRCCTNFLYDVYYQVYPYMRSFFSDWQLVIDEHTWKPSKGLKLEGFTQPWRLYPKLAPPRWWKDWRMKAGPIMNDLL